LLEENAPGVQKASGFNKYPLALKIYYPVTGDLVHNKYPFILLQFTSKKASKPQIRFEYNPAHMTEAGEAYLDVIFILLVGMSFYEFLFHARFTRVDFCRNIAHRDVEDYLIRSKWSKVSQCFFDATGKLETINLGKSGGIQIIAYNKAKQLYGDAATYDMIRIEARCTINLNIYGLAKLLNPFDRVTVYSVACKKPPFGEAHWRAFQDSCRLRGVGNAIKKQPVKCHSALKKALSSLPVSWWSIEAGDAYHAWDWHLTSALENAGLTNIPNVAPPLTLVNAAGMAA
jgi:hypothetical protein